MAQKASSSEGPLEISVHCDVEVFGWLVRYVTGAVSQEQLDVERVLPLLIAGNFLQARGGTEEAVVAGTGGGDGGGDYAAAREWD